MSVPGPSSHGIVHKNTVDIDESLYSRQLYVLGHEGQRRMAGSSVLLMGLSGAGVETAKNIILAGVKSLALFDPQPSSFMDLASQFYLNEGDVVNGRARAEACAPLLAELNPYVDVSVIPSHFSLYQLQDLIASKAVSCLVLVDQSMDTMQPLADTAHMAGVCVIVASVKGVCGSVFCDFGTSFLVTDSDGEAPMSSLLASVVVDPHTAPLTAIISTLEESRHGLESGDIIALSDIMGSVGDVLNGREFSVTVKDLNCFEVCLDECARGQTLQYEGGGYANQVKQSVVRSFRRFSDSINCPGPFHGHEYKIYRAGLMHLLFRWIDCMRAHLFIVPTMFSSCMSMQGLSRLHSKV